MQFPDLLAALALVLVIEGLLPFASPDRAKQLYAQLAASPSQLLRRMGIISIVVGLVVLYFVRGTS